MNIYKGKLIIPVRITATDAAGAMAYAQKAARIVSVAICTCNSIKSKLFWMARDTYEEPQARINIVATHRGVHVDDKPE